MAEVKFLPQAEKEFLGFSPDLQAEIIHKTELLGKFPFMGRAMDEAFAGYRFVLAGKNRYRVIYRVLPDGAVEIAYFRHCRRQLGLRLVRGE